MLVNINLEQSISIIVIFNILLFKSGAYGWKYKVGKRYL